MTELKTDRFYIGGQWVAPQGGETLDVINPATEEIFASVAMGTTADVDAAVAAAKAAFPAFSRTTKAERLELLAAIRSAYQARYDEMAQAISEEMGAPISLSDRAQAAVGIGHLDGVVKALEAFEFEHKNAVGDLILHEPIGVCGFITPWNWPINQIALKVIPAIAAGCTMVLKPSELTPMSALLYAEILADAGVPAGVFNLVNGDGPTVGAAISSHPDVAMISFTGSTRAGVEISKAAAATVKRVTLELGGKSPNILLDDCDLDAAVKRGVRHCFQNTGQSCNAPTRMLVPANQYETAMEIAKEAAEATTVGLPSLPGSHIGPLVSQMQYDRVQSLIQVGIEDGARVVAGGLGRPEGFNRGYFCRPTVFGDVTNDMRIAQEEVFGPVLVMIAYQDDADAVRIANDTPYGLAAYIQTGDEARGLAMARDIRAGMVHLNGSDISYGSPFGGYKLSGNGREGGVYGIEDFCEIKAISV
ncbi:MAG: aldehyde dehydrogenase family protein [Alphaproteobacteria bacterium]|nr:aldehyde dehydrogenase family protein [Alphaproteobacteria bacterium]MBU1571896.1 aldehyde dehydrogenase family protein [Alphaproteobacteria bacterium]MBU1828123.1 aldehyde dehydrogenase family protein [Alphaproteobacteria bacterium]MBU2078374.1 aldehyde dehydrogenase family protein [Alphaproteobacteria bacterium]MBU2159521.1 aldehyde dehydrogenase family protein [Alphaproteobacteria bacterium]